MIKDAPPSLVPGKPAGPARLGPALPSESWMKCRPKAHIQTPRGEGCQGPVLQRSDRHRGHSMWRATGLWDGTEQGTDTRLGSRRTAARFLSARAAVTR